MRLGVLGGTFDPPHWGHLLLGEIAREQLELDRVLFVPAGSPPHKPHQPISPIHHRCAMIQLAIAGNPYFQLDTTDADRPPPHYTVTLLPLLQQKQPSANWWLLMGGDSLNDLPTWKNPHCLIDLATLAVLPRPNIPLNPNQLEQAIPNLFSKVELLHGPEIYLSSTLIREWIANKRSLRYLMPASVQTYITTHQLYI